MHLACREGEVRLYRIPMLEDDPTETRVISDPVAFLFALLLERYESARAYSALRQAVRDAGLSARDGFRDY